VRLAAEPPLKPYVDIPRMANHRAGDAARCPGLLSRRGHRQGRCPSCRRDAEVDQINKQLYRELTSFMIEKPGTISRAIELMFISKSIERIADHATNIAEEMIYLAKGKDVRHDDSVKHGDGQA
jgi:phosphate transport system protein